jgi:Ras-related protein Rab-21
VGHLRPRPPTVEAGFLSKKVETSNGYVTLSLWDTAGQEEYYAVAAVYYKDAQAALIVYSVVNETSFELMRHWHQTLHQIVGNSIKIFVVANKIDLPGRNVTSAQGVQYANSIGCRHFEVSAKTGEGLDMLFRCVAEELAEAHATAGPRVQRQSTRGRGPLEVIDAGQQPPQKSNCC